MAITVYLSLVFLVLYLTGLAIRKLIFVRDKGRMERESRSGARFIARVEEVAPGSVKKFWLICQEYRIDAFLVNYQGEFHAYVNRCRHMTTPLDFVRDEFFNDDRRYLMCYTHGALYEPLSGQCVAGPCKGESLYSLPLRIEQGEVLVSCPAGDLSHLAD